MFYLSNSLSILAFLVLLQKDPLCGRRVRWGKKPLYRKMHPALHSRILWHEHLHELPTSCTVHRLVHTPHSVPTSCTVHRLVHTPHSVPTSCTVHRLVHTPHSVPTSCTVHRLVHTPHSVPTSCTVHRLVHTPHSVPTSYLMCTVLLLTTKQ